jgi:hypothetical protein
MGEWLSDLREHSNYKFFAYVRIAGFPNVTHIYPILSAVVNEL